MSHDAGHLPGPPGSDQASPGDHRLEHFQAALLRHHDLPPCVLNHHHNPTICREPDRYCVNSFTRSTTQYL